MNPSDPIVIVGGGQSGLAAARAVRDSGLRPIVLEAGDRPVGSWPDYYDSLSLFSLARYSAMPDRPFPGEDDRYPRRDEVVDYLANYAADLDVEIRVNTKVESVTAEVADSPCTPATVRRSCRWRCGGDGLFSNPHRPALAGQDEFTGELLHVASYRELKF